jgi:predicted Fe-S protein YdhL (DUF1289 family)
MLIEWPDKKTQLKARSLAERILAYAKKLKAAFIAKNGAAAKFAEEDCWREAKRAIFTDEGLGRDQMEFARWGRYVEKERVEILAESRELAEFQAEQRRLGAYRHERELGGDEEERNFGRVK